MTLVPLAQLPDQPTLSEVLGFQLTGLIVVFGALATLWLVLELMGVFFRRRQAQKTIKKQPVAKARTKAAEPPAPAAPAEDGLSPVTVAAVAAAVHVALGGRPHRVVSIRASNGSTSWAAEGRREHFSSHRVR